MQLNTSLSNILFLKYYFGQLKINADCKIKLGLDRLILCFKKLSVLVCNGCSASILFLNPGELISNGYNGSAVLYCSGGRTSTDELLITFPDTDTKIDDDQLAKLLEYLLDVTE